MVDSTKEAVLAAGLKVENVRVGKMTNWDKLIINLTTDGTITPEEAFANSVNILADQFSSLVIKEEKSEKKEEKNKEKEEKKEEKEEVAKKTKEKEEKKEKKETKKKTKKTTAKKETKKAK